MSELRANPDANDQEHLRLLAVFHYVCAGIMALGACVPLIHLVLGLFMVFSPQTFGPAKGQQPPLFVGWLFIGLASVIILLGWAMALLTAYSGRCLQKRRRYMFSFVIAAIMCVFMPFGTVLGVFTLVVLSRPSVKPLFAPTGAA